MNLMLIITFIALAILRVTGQSFFGTNIGLYEHDLLRSFPTPSNNAKVFAIRGLDGFAAYGLKPGSKIKFPYSLFLPEKLYEEFAIITTVKPKTNDGGFLFSVVDPLDTVVQLGIQLIPSGDGISNITLLYSDVSMRVSQKIASFVVPAFVDKWTKIGLSVMKDKITLLLNCNDFQTMVVQRNPLQLTFVSASVLYVGEAGPLLGGAFDGGLQELKLIGNPGTTVQCSHIQEDFGSGLGDYTINLDQEEGEDGSGREYTMPPPIPSHPPLFDDYRRGEKGEKGPKGEAIRGPPGPPGPPGLSGPPGPPGPSPSFTDIPMTNIDLSGSGFGSGYDEKRLKEIRGEGYGPPGQCSCNITKIIQSITTLDMLKGPRGPVGADGKTGAPGLTGQPGIPGERGPLGPRGERGERGDSGAEGPEGPIGPKGEPGVDGMPGTPGPPGSPGPPGPVSHGGSDESVFGSGAGNSRPGTPGPKGEPGIMGPSGTQGEKGFMGHKGERGEIGHRGHKGDKGSTGVTGPLGSKGERGPPGTDGLPGLPGTNGQPAEKGEKGEQGLEGKPGPPGPPTRSIDDDVRYDGSDGTRVVAGPQGPSGEKGSLGPKGEKGSRGIEGPQGYPGNDGKPGERGEIGPSGMPGIEGPLGSSGPKGDKGAPCLPVPGSNAEFVPIKGEKGEQGPRGKRGRQGIQGIQGTPGKPGTVGDIGLPGWTGSPGTPGTGGLPGAPGIKGDKGDSSSGMFGFGSGQKGDKGDRGTNGTPGTNGSNGAPGPPGPPGPAGSGSSVEDGSVRYVTVPGPPGPPGPAGPAGLSVVGQKGEPGFSMHMPVYGDTSTHSRPAPPNPSPSSSYQQQGRMGGEEEQQQMRIVPGAVTFQNTDTMIKMASLCPVGTLAYKIDEEVLLVRVTNGWQYISLGSLLPTTTQAPPTTSPPQPHPPFEASNLINNVPLPVEGPNLRMAALNEPVSGDMHGIRGADYACYRQARRAGLRGTFRAFLSSRVQNIDSIVRWSDRDLPVVNTRGDVLFNSWGDLFDGAGGLFAQSPRIYSFNGKNILQDISWPQKIVWHGSHPQGERAMDTYCDAWHSDSPDKVGLASSLLGHKLLDQERYSCNNRFALLCIEATSQASRKKRGIGSYNETLRESDALSMEEYQKILEELKTNED